MNEKIKLTRLGIKNINKKLEYLKNKKLPEIINEISKARAFGDLSENSEYQIAKKNQRLIEKKISELENILLNCKLINSKNKKKFIDFSAKIKLKNLKNNKILSYEIVDDAEIGVKSNLISLNSPIGILLSGKKVNDIINFKKFNKNFKFKIISIEY